jgi:hypothetical protein
MEVYGPYRLKNMEQKGQMVCIKMDEVSRMQLDLIPQILIVGASLGYENRSHQELLEGLYTS